MQSRLLLTSLLGLLASAPASLLAAPLPYGSYDTTGLVQQQQQLQQSPQSQSQSLQGMTVQQLPQTDQAQQQPPSRGGWTNPYGSSVPTTSSDASGNGLVQQADSGYALHTSGQAPSTQNSMQNTPLTEASGSDMAAMAPAQKSQSDSGDSSSDQGMSSTDKMSIGIGAAGAAATAVGAGATIVAVKKANEAQRLMVDHHGEMKQMLAPQHAQTGTAPPHPGTETLPTYDEQKPPVDGGHDTTSKVNGAVQGVRNVLR